MKRKKQHLQIFAPKLKLIYIIRMQFSLNFNSQNFRWEKKYRELILLYSIITRVQNMFLKSKTWGEK